MARRIIEHVLGTDRPYPMVIRGSSGAAITSYKPANPVTAVIWRGDDLEQVATPEVIWRTATAGTCTVKIARSDIAGLEPGDYRTQCFVEDTGGDRRCFADFTLRLVATPGQATPRKTYGTADAMLVYFPGLAQLQADSDETGFGEQRALARRWIDRLIVQWWDGRKPGVSAPRVIRLGIDCRTSEPDRTWLRDILDGNGLVVTDLVSEMAAKKALAIVLAAQLADTTTVTAGRKSAHQQAGDKFEAEVEALAKTFIAEIDTDGDDVADLFIDCRKRAAIY